MIQLNYIKRTLKSNELTAKVTEISGLKVAPVAEGIAKE